MVKQTIFYLCLSILVVLFSRYFATIIVQIDHFYAWLNLRLSSVFSHSATGLTVQQIIVLMMLPVAVVGAPALAYRVVKGGTMPHFLNAIWLVWLIVVLSKIAVQ